MATGLFNLKQVNQAISQGAWSGYIAPRWVEYLTVAGGGGGGAGGGGGGGGGAGGLLTGIVTVAAGASYTVTVGGGGTAGASANGGDGVASVFGSISATGGGGGGWTARGANGGSGGGNGANVTGFPVGLGIVGQGNNGNIADGNSIGGGGGGAGTAGIAGVSTQGGAGGAGIASSISGTVIAYSGGGGGGGSGPTPAGAGGVGGGGGGGTSSGVGTVGSSNTGGGGGAGGGGNVSGGAGGSGIVVVRYPGNVQFYTGGTVTYSNGYIVHNFTANGTLAPTTPTVVSEYQISRSLRFNSADSAYLNRTFTTPTNNTVWSFSFWLKRSTLSTQQYFLNVNSYSGIGTNSDSIVFWSNAGTTLATSTAVFRDVSAWYHVVVASNGTTITAYVNNSSVLTYTGTITNLNSAVVHNIGRDQTSNSAYFNGYMTEINFIDGQALTPSSFGYVNPTTGIWSPAKFVGGYGTNGFYLNFSDNSNTTAATLGADYSGNGNNWTPNNFSVTAGAGNDSLVDSPTSYGTDTGVGGTVRGNYCTLNPLIYRYGYPTITTFSNGNLDALMTSAAVGSYIFGSIFVSSGKWYWETTINAIGNVGGGTGIDNGNKAYDLSTGSYYYYSNGSKASSGSLIAYGASYTTGDIIGTAYDADAGTLTFYKNGTSQGVAFTGITGQNCYFGTGENGFSISTNFGQRAFAYTAPSGFKALCTQNLPTPTIGATSATLAGKYFNTVLYTGNGGTNNITGVGFQPDLVWGKSRNAAYNHGLLDSVRGISRWLGSNDPSAEDYTAGAYVTAFNSDGFTAGAGGVFNNTSTTYVAWNWRASGTTVSNTSGSITTTVSVNTTSGFSIVSYVGVASSPVTIGHGLGVAPSFIIVKNRDVSSAWYCYHSALGPSYRTTLNSNAASFSVTGLWNGTAPTSTVFSTVADTTTNNTGSNHVAYCFAPVAGYSAFGSYTGNGSTDGPFVYTGFRPALLLVKRTDTTADWVIFDSARNGYNIDNKILFPNGSSAESTGGTTFDILSNGFKARNTNGEFNGNNSPYIYMAFASNPFKYSLAR